MPTTTRTLALTPAFTASPTRNSFHLSGVDILALLKYRCMRAASALRGVLMRANFARAGAARVASIAGILAGRKGPDARPLAQCTGMRRRLPVGVPGAGRPRLAGHARIFITKASCPIGQLSVSGRAPTGAYTASSRTQVSNVASYCTHYHQR